MPGWGKSRIGRSTESEKIRKIICYVRMSLYEGKTPNNEGYYVYTKKEITNGANIPYDSFHKGMQQSVANALDRDYRIGSWAGYKGYADESIFSNISCDRGRLCFKRNPITMAEELTWLWALPPINGGFYPDRFDDKHRRRVSAGVVVYDAYPDFWSEQKIAAYNKSHGINIYRGKPIKKKRPPRREGPRECPAGKEYRSLYALKSGNYLEVRRDPDPINPRDYASGLAKFYTYGYHFGRQERSIDKSQYDCIAGLMDEFGLSRRASSTYTDGSEWINTKDSSRGVLLIPIRIRNGSEYHFGTPTYPGDNSFDDDAKGAAVVTQDDICRLGLHADISKNEGIEEVLSILQDELDKYNVYFQHDISEMRIYDKNGIENEVYRQGNFFGLNPNDNGMRDVISAMGDEIIRDLGYVTPKQAAWWYRKTAQ